MNDWTTLAELPCGAIFVTRDGIRAVKSEYHLTNGQCKCILLASGEYAHFPERNQVEVREIDLEELLAERERCARIADKEAFGHGIMSHGKTALDPNEERAAALACEEVARRIRAVPETT